MVIKKKLPKIKKKIGNVNNFAETPFFHFLFV